MDVSKKRSGGSVQSASPKKQKTGKKSHASKGKPKDDNKPKRPKTAYLHFMDAFRQQRKNDVKNGEEKSTKIGDVAKDGGIAWAKMSDEDKLPYTEKYDEEKVKYDKKMKEYKPAKDENKPKRPMTAFLLFLGEIRPKLKADGLTGPEVSKRAGEKWRAMSDAEKKKYVDLQEKLKSKYDDDMKDYLAQNPAPPKEKAKKSKAKVPVESESEEEDEEEEDDDEEDDDEEEEESD